MDPMTMMAVMAGVQAVSKIGEGLAQNSAAKRAASLQDTEAGYIEDEGELQLQDMVRAATQRLREVRDFRERQSLAYLSSGVDLAGTPLIMMERTRRLGQQEVDALLKRGVALRDLAYRRADMTRMGADNTRAAGRSAMFGGFLGAAGSAMQTFAAGQRMGTYGQANANIPTLTPESRATTY